MLLHMKQEFESLVLNCESQCPSCGKFCDRVFHPHGGRCEIKTGHKICSMGGKVGKMTRIEQLSYSLVTITRTKL